MVEETALKPLSALQKWVIAFALVSMGVGMTISFVVAPPLARDAGLSEIQVAGVLTLSSLFFTFLTPVWGNLANRYGRKRVMAFALFSAAITNAAFILSLSAALKGMVVGLNAFLLLAVVRLSFGVLASGLQPASFASMTDSTTAKDRAAGLGFLGAAMSVGSILGPSTAALLAPIDPLAPLWGSVAFSAIGGLIVMFTLPNDATVDHDSVRPKRMSFLDPRVRGYLIFLMSYFIAVACVQQTLAWFVTDRFDLDRSSAVEAAGWVFGVMSLTMILTQTFYVSRYKPKPEFMLPLGLLLVPIGYGLSILPLPFLAMCASFGLVGIGSALIVPAINALGTLAVDPHEQGGAAGLLSAAPPAGFVLGPLLGAWLYMFNRSLPLIVSAVAMSTLLGFVLLRMRGRRGHA